VKEKGKHEALEKIGSYRGDTGKGLKKKTAGQWENLREGIGESKRINRMKHGVKRKKKPGRGGGEGGGGKKCKRKKRYR